MNRFFLLSIILLAAKAEAQTSALVIADSLYAVGNYTRAIETLKEISPQNNSIHGKLAKAYQAKGQLETAKDFYKKVLETNPERIVTAVDYAKLLVRTGDLVKADSVFSGLVKKYPGSANF